MVTTYQKDNNELEDATIHVAVKTYIVEEGSVNLTVAFPKDLPKWAEFL